MWRYFQNLSKYIAPIAIFILGSGVYWSYINHGLDHRQHTLRLLEDRVAIYHQLIEASNLARTFDCVEGKTPEVRRNRRKMELLLDQWNQIERELSNLENREPKRIIGDFLDRPCPPSGDFIIKIEPQQESK